MSHYDIIVIGAGPAGANAALTANGLGLQVLLIDEQAAAGGQVWRDKSKSILEAPATEISQKGDALREQINQSSIDVYFETRVWYIEKDEDQIWHLGLQSDAATDKVSSKSLIIATGAQERIIPIEGWTLPGVFGLAGATALFKEHMMVPGHKTVVAGNGPLVFYVANEILRLGGNVSAVVTLNSKFDWLKVMPAMMTHRKLVMQGIKWILNLREKRIPIYWKHGLRRIIGVDKIEAVDIRKVNSNWNLKRNIKVLVKADSVCFGHGLMSETTATRLAGADHFYDERFGGWMPKIDFNGRTSVKNLYACGDNAGVLGVLAAPHRGRLSAYAAYVEMGGEISDEAQKIRSGERAEFIKAQKFGMAAAQLSIVRSGVATMTTENVEVCRCEGITRAEIEGEIRNGAVSQNAVKSGTRCGMGPCGGRFCSESLAIITKNITKQTREEIGQPYMRPPLKPVCIDEISDDLEYDDLPIPGVSPL